MSCAQLPYLFQLALSQSQSYPKNTIYKTIDAYPKFLERAESQLSDREWDLFEDNPYEWEVPIRDLDTACGKDIDKYNVHNHQKLLERLGICVQKPLTNAPTVISTRKDPKCRFIYLYGSHSRAKLRLTRAMLLDILTFHQVMPTFLDFLYVFGQQSETTELQFSSFKEQVVLTNPPDELVLPSLGRSGKHYQMCYNLKSAALKSKNTENSTLNEWTIRQVVVHHQFDVINGNILWIVLRGNIDIQQRFKALTDRNARSEDKSFGTPEDCFRSSLSAQLMYCYAATEDWRWYIKWLENVVDKEHIMAVIGPPGVGYAHKTYTPRDIQDLQIWEEKTRRVILALEGNLDVMLALVSFYRKLSRNKSFPLRKPCASDICAFASQVENIVSDFRMQIKRAEFLVRTISDRRQLVIQHLQSQSASRAERLSRSMEQEQVFMLIITVVTLIYLPATFVSTFFSTNVVKYQDSNSPGGTFSAVAMKRWLQVTIPLTVLTCGVAYLARQYMVGKRREGEFGLEEGRSTLWTVKNFFNSSVALLPFHNRAPHDPKGSFFNRVMTGRTQDIELSDT
ncbi:uncharacterized protein F4822DRAFT_408912 [Hypoxylon trugodes]|uniref:uncharacterized protein n=1 Tax=Hypoxylon trugodes TaxID=326681 RepID=UPI002199F918|nr:uncharacterized protein F4822DRAFT_408912 [Hypoxylon trugodes]KAI1386094.1 hypothetical protein F4822DRAFT_408912 [Hypoxylon trugodes]